MANGFWAKLKKPIFVLAPMANVTDAAFRFIIAKYGKPDVMFTEFVSCDGLCSPGREALLRDLWFSSSERPIVAQIFGSKPDNFYRAALLLRELGFDGIDINLGCPDRSVEKQGAGAGLMKNPKLAQKIITETKRGAGSLPVSVKTRIGYQKDELDSWLPYLLEVEPAAITIHARTRQEMSDVPARWDVFPRVMAMVGSSRRTLILGNGDVASLEAAVSHVAKYGVDGVMIGRGIFGNPWLFNRMTAAKEIKSVSHTKEAFGDTPISLGQRLAVMLEHAFLYERMFGGLKNFAIMKKHFKAYVSGFDGARDLRAALMETTCAQAVKEVLDKWGVDDLSKAERNFMIETVPKL